MNATQLLAHFDRLADAPNAVPRLRRFILDLAVRGKLVAQDEEDEPAAELLTRIDAERLRHLQKPVKGSASPAIEPESTDIELPVGWAWSRLGSLCTKTGSGSTPSGGKDAYVSSGVPFLRSQNVYDEGLRLDGVAFISESTQERMSSSTVKPGDLLLNITGGSIGRCAVVPDSFVIGNINQHVAIIRLALLESGRFLHSVICSDYFQKNIFGNQTGAGREGLPKNRMDEILVPVAPLSEQHRIVAKVDELTALCDQLEAAQQERERRRDRLAVASLQGLNLPALDVTPEVQREHSRFYLDNLPRLTTRPEHIMSMRQKCIDLAISGRILSQDADDKSASELLAAEIDLPSGYVRRRKMLKDASVEAPSSLFPDIPSTWAYSDIQSLYDLNAIIDYADGNHGALYPRSEEFGGTGVNFVTARDLVDGRVEWGSCAKLNQERASQLVKGWAQENDVLLTHNATVGRVARVEAGIERFLLGTSVTFYRLNPRVLDADFFYYFLKSSIWQGQLAAIMAQTTRNQVSIQKQAFFRVVVPPFAEQHRIARKVDELMALCDQLEAQLTTTQTDSRRLLEAVLEAALAPA